MVLAEKGNHVAVEEGPGGFAVQAEDGFGGVGWAFIEIVETEAVRLLEVVRGKGIVG